MNFVEAKQHILTRLEKELDKTLYYHSLKHVYDVYHNAEILGKNEGIEGRDYTLLLTAALYHDAGFVIMRENHEEVSCTLAKEVLPKFGYSNDDLTKICGMIMATKIPQSPKNHLEEIICDADLDYLGRDDFFSIGNALYAELKEQGILTNEKDWNRMQVKFLKSHTYFTQTSQKLKAPKKQEHIEQLESLVASY